MRRVILAVLAPGIAAASCADGTDLLPGAAPPASTDAGLDPDAGAPPGRIQVLPPVLSFGLVSVLAPTRRSLLVTNAGFGPLEVQSAAIDDALVAAGFSLGPVDLPTRLTPGDHLELALSLAANEGFPAEGYITVRSDDPVEPAARVRVLAEGTDCCPCRWRIAPEAVDFGPVALTSTSVAETTVVNEGPSACLLTVDPGPDCTAAFGYVGPRPLRLAPTASVAFPVRFAPAEVGRQACTLQLRDGHIFGEARALVLLGLGIE